MLFTTDFIKTEELNSINNFFVNVDCDNVTEVVEEENTSISNISKYLNCLVSSQYAKAVDDIENTKLNNRIKRKRNLQQIMQESFFYGANRFGNNFIA